MKRDRVNGIVGVIIGVLIIAGALRLPPSKVPDDIGPAVFPIIAAVMIIIPGLFLTFKKAFTEECPFLNRQEWKRLGILVLVFILYAVLLYMVGFLVATPIITFIISKMFSQGKKVPAWQLIVYALILTIIVYMCFYKGLGLKLPRGEFFNLDL
ncbi:tripartite tricarboxylate transporter TctB family protein [Clostridium sp. AM58-1XD]|uniref:tripartite tricarboxylate transporter TctB family protein n=1 Tax=Clostridium sp. AM58-1XD TaxID=2292307 RepID=UPI000E4706FB|nr:tripartite tricarboxylate transporter TctB family protein [Clostridium sp. AM58-1XD]RGZ01276.1 tripartite tricarboxylate transporter TctB family protein [Clostridium sp. AM58-1XD]